MSIRTVMVHVECPDDDQETMQRMLEEISTVEGVREVLETADTAEESESAATADNWLGTEIHRRARLTERARLLLPSHGHTEYAIEGKSMRLHDYFAGLIQGLDLSCDQYFLPLWGRLYLQYLDETYPALHAEIYDNAAGSHPLSNPLDRGIYLPFVDWAARNGHELATLREACEMAYEREREKSAKQKV